MSITILIPTKNRYQYLDKLLKFYSLNGIKYNLFVIDSSEKKFKSKNISILKKYKNLRINYYFALGWTTEVMKNISSKINTKYCCFAGDDDFLIKDGLDKCEIFLKNNKEFIGCIRIFCFIIFMIIKFINSYSGNNRRVEKILIKE